MGKVKELPDGRRMLGGGCESCPVEACATSTYRGSACESQRALYGLGDPLTNADRIRAMADEEFAKAASATFRCPPGDYKCLQMPEPLCYECWLAWLKQPVEEET